MSWEPRKDFEYNEAKRFDRNIKTGRRVRVEHGARGGYASYLVKGAVVDRCVGYKSETHSQCRFKGTREHHGLLFCGHCHPPTIFERIRAKKEARENRWAYHNKLQQFEAKCAAWEYRCMQALREIAKGELNDPAGYAAMILDEEPKQEG